jgi:hypothetical protein
MLNNLVLTISTCLDNSDEMLGGNRKRIWTAHVKGKEYKIEKTLK